MRNGSGVEFVDLISPLTPEEFFRDVWEQRPLVRPCPAGAAFTALMSWEAVDRVLYAAAHQHRAVQLFRDGDWLPDASYTVRLPPRDSSEGEFRIAVDPPSVYAEFRRGAAIKLRDLQRSHPPVARFARRLQEVFGFPVGATAFLSPPNADPKRGEPKIFTHYDPHDQFTLQVAGSKRWRIYDAPYPLPLGHQLHEQMGVSPGECSSEVTLRAGDVLYLPRGYFHEVVAADEPSIHLVFILRCFRWIDALRAAVESLSGDVRFRKSMPVRAVTEEGHTEFRAQFDRIKQLALDAMSADAAAADLRRSFLREHRPVLDGHFLDWLRLDQVSADTVVRRRPGTMSETADDGRLRLRLGDRTIGGPGLDPASVRFVTSQHCFRVADLPGPPDEAGKVALAKRLIAGGALGIVASPSDD